MRAMFARLPAFLRVPTVMLLIAASTVVHTLPLFVVALLRWVLPGGIGRACGRALVRIAESWIAFNAALVRGFTPTVLDVQGGEGLRLDGHYLVIANHQSWVDIIMLQTALNRRMPFMRFFLKQQLIWVPLLGLAWWALDFPFMRRASRKELARRPELARRDMDATRRACNKFKGMPVAIMNFVEGTRFTADKHRRQASPYAHLLKPKAGGVGFALEAMDGALHSVVDVTLAYPAGIPTLLDLVAGRIPVVRLRIRERPIPAELQGVDVEADAQARVRVQRWINAMWVDKDAELDALLAAGATADAAGG
jgi:1-acyl-sn-glycerol-3-phosphate acyltransferase